MLQAKQIRNDVFTKLNGTIEGITTYHNGRPLVLDDTQLPAVAVYLDDLQTDDSDLGGSYWNAKLNIALYVPGAVNESALDDLSEEVVSYIGSLDFLTTENIQLETLTHQHDEQGFVWRGVNIQYGVSFYRSEDECD